MQSEVIKYYLPVWSISALVNGDHSGIDESESETVTSFEKDLNEYTKEFKCTHWTIGDISEPYFRHDNDLESLCGDCCDVDIVFMK